MLNVTTLVDFVKDLRGLVTEQVRGEIARRIENLIADVVRVADIEAYKQWVHSDRLKFIRYCELNPTHIEGLEVCSTQLSEFCNKWLSVNLFKTKDSEDWRPITPDMNSLRVTMVEELKKLG